MIEILREQPEFHAGRLKMWVERSSLHPLYDTGLPTAIIREARTEGLGAAMQLLQDVLAAEKAKFIRIVPVWGLSVEQPTWITDDICIAPMHRIPSSPPYRYFMEKHQPSFSDHFFAILPPPVALIASFQTMPFVIADGYVPPPPERQAAIARLDDLRICLSLAGPRTIIPSVHWEQFADPRLANIMMPALAYPNIEIMPQEIADAREPLDLNAAAEVFSALGEHRDSDRIRLALARFDSGMRRRMPGDGAVEMATALEAIMINDDKPAAIKLARRSAILREGVPDKRSKTYSIIRGVSMLRNKVVHTGTMPNAMDLSDLGMGTVVVTEFVADATRVVADVIRAAILRRRLPSKESDWFAEEKGGGSGAVEDQI